MAEAYTYAIQNIPIALMSIFLVPLAILAIIRAVIKIFANF